MGGRVDLEVAALGAPVRRFPALIVLLARRCVRRLRWKLGLQATFKR
jgi:hypothetical protein